MDQVLILRYGELSLKGKNRPDFEHRLRERLQYALRHQPGARVRKGFGRFFVEELADVDAALAAVQQVFGLVSVSPACRVPADLAAIREAALRVAAAEHGPAAAEHRPPRAEHRPEAAPARPLRFKVDARRADKRFPLTSQELNQELGAYLLEQLPGLSVDLHHPDLVVSVEVRDGQAYVFTQVLPGPGGLPYGSGGRALLLLSGGIDSPVAGWLAMKRGITVEPIHFHSFPFTSQRSREKVLDLAAVLAGWVGPVTVHMVSVAEIQTEIRRHCPEDLHITILRRFMFRLAQAVAARRGALALVTGESVGQVASQTLESMMTINAVTNLPVLRPLVTMDKAEIMALARRIGTYDLSILPYEDCCTLFVPKHPRTRPRPEQAERAEARLDVAGLVTAALATVEQIEVGPEQERAVPAPVSRNHDSPG